MLYFDIYSATESQKGVRVVNIEYMMMHALNLMCMDIEITFKIDCKHYNNNNKEYSMTDGGVIAGHIVPQDLTIDSIIGIRCEGKK